MGSPVKDAIGQRMKANYESVADYRLTRRMPVIVRVDGKAFHTYTRKFRRPFDSLLRECMCQAMLELCMESQGCVLGYCQSDEISMLLIDYKKLNSEAWLDYRIQKLASVSAAIAGVAFNNAIVRLKEVFNGYECVRPNALFDARVFNIPREEVANYFLWRQMDATRNSINLAGQTYFSSKALHGKSCNEVQEMLMSEKGINWNDYPTEFKRGTACVKTESGGWKLDKEMPVLKGQDREYVEKLLSPEEE